MKKSNDHSVDSDRILWAQAEQTGPHRLKKASRPSPDELSQFLDHTANKNVQEKVLQWLASEDGAVEELLMLRQPLIPESLIDKTHLKEVESRARTLVATTLEASKKTRSPSLWTFLLDFLYLRTRVATAIAACLLIISSAFAFHLGISTFQNRWQANTVIINELTFGLTESLPPKNPLNQVLSSHGGS